MSKFVLIVLFLAHTLGVYGKVMFDSEEITLLGVNYKKVNKIVYKSRWHDSFLDYIDFYNNHSELSYWRNFNAKRSLLTISDETVEYNVGRGHKEYRLRNFDHHSKDFKREIKKYSSEGIFLTVDGLIIMSHGLIPNYSILHLANALKYGVVTEDEISCVKNKWEWSSGYCDGSHRGCGSNDKEVTYCIFY